MTPVTVTWDILLMKSDSASVAELFEHSVPPPLGGGDDVRSKVSAVVPGIQFQEPTWAQIQGDGWSIDLTVGSEEPVESLLLHVHGGAEALATVRRLAEALDARALDCSTGAFIDFSAPPGGPTEHPQVLGWKGPSCS
jgi:hypothetical protein